MRRGISRLARRGVRRLRQIRHVSQRRRHVSHNARTSVGIGVMSRNTAITGAVGQRSFATNSDPKSKSQENIEKQYQKRSQREHILLRPETYIGAVSAREGEAWVLKGWNSYASAEVESKQDKGLRMVYEEAKFVPGLLHIIDEILVNAADNIHRRTGKSLGSQPMSEIGVVIGRRNASDLHSSLRGSVEKDAPYVRVENDGAGIPVVVHQEHSIFVPELVFGHMLTSSNYDDKVMRLTGGRHGYGAKLTNIFSHYFTICLHDGLRELLYFQNFRDNMSNKSPPLVLSTRGLKTVGELLELTDRQLRGRVLVPESVSQKPAAQRNAKDAIVTQLRELLQGDESGHGAMLQDFASKAVGKHKSWTSCEFAPDLSRFNLGMSESGDSGSYATPWDEVFEGILRRRVFDIAATVSPYDIRCSMNNRPIPIHSFGEYLSLYPMASFVTHAARGAVMQREVARLQEQEVVAKSESSLPESMLFTAPNKYWQVAVGPHLSEVSADGKRVIPGRASGLQQLSFVNNIHTPRGGTHVDWIADQVARHVAAHIKKNAKRFGLEDDAVIRPGLVKAHMTMFVSAVVPNPTFDSQTKDVLVTPFPSLIRSIKKHEREQAKSKGKRKASGEAAMSMVMPPTLTSSYLDRICSESGLVDSIVWWLQARSRRAALNTFSSVEDNTRDRRLSESQRAKREVLRIAKLEDANWAGTKRANECSLIVTEGDSAKALALSGLSVLGRDRYGVFPVRGKMLNVRDASLTAISKNQEVQNLIKILGLRVGRDYSTERARSSLRYGRVLLMADQDYDGSHIKGLFLNMIHSLWPSLVQAPFDSEGESKSGPHPSFLREFVTPVLKVTFQPAKGRGKKYTVPFYSVHDYETFSAARETKNEADYQPAGLELQAGQDMFSDRIVNVKYYKGLGTSTSSEGKKYFSNLRKHVIDFCYGGKDDDDSLVLAFKKTLANKRKEWLSDGIRGVDTMRALGYATDSNVAVDNLDWRKISFSDFVNHELILFSHSDNVRSIPHVLDGLKPGQRKILFGCFKRKLNKEIKVAQVAGYVSEHTGYHHGEAALHGTIVKMAQDYVGSNNLPLLTPSGQFGTRHLGGADAASARYIFTKLHENTRSLFPVEDDPLYVHMDEDGVLCDPEFYIPVLPLVLCNGPLGIGTGFSTAIPCFNPLDLIGKLRSLLVPYSSNSERECPAVGDLHPWWFGFDGYLMSGSEAGKSQGPPESYVTVGRLQSDGTGRRPKRRRRKRGSASSPSCEITELPIMKWTQNYKEFLTEWMSADGRTESKSARQKREGKRGRGAARQAAKTKTAGTNMNAPYLSGVLDQFSEHHTDQQVRFRLEFNNDRARARSVRISGDELQTKLFNAERNLKQAVGRTNSAVQETVIPSSSLDEDSAQLLSDLRLTSAVSLRNMHAFRPNGRLQRYQQAEDMLMEFVPYRMYLYSQRKRFGMYKLREKLNRVIAQLWFVCSVRKGEDGSEVGTDDHLLSEITTQHQGDGDISLDGLELFNRPKHELERELFARNFPIFCDSSSLLALHRDVGSRAGDVTESVQDTERSHGQTLHALPLPDELEKALASVQLSGDEADRAYGQKFQALLRACGVSAQQVRDVCAGTIADHKGYWRQSVPESVFPADLAQYAIEKAGWSQGDAPLDADALGVDIRGGYDYLLNMPLSSLTRERLGALVESAQKLQNSLADLERLSEADLWLRDLDRLEKGILRYYDRRGELLRN